MRSLISSLTSDNGTMENILSRRSPKAAHLFNLCCCIFVLVPIQLPVLLKQLLYLLLDLLVVDVEGDVGLVVGGCDVVQKAWVVLSMTDFLSLPPTLPSTIVDNLICKAHGVGQRPPGVPHPLLLDQLQHLPAGEEDRGVPQLRLG